MFISLKNAAEAQPVWVNINHIVWAKALESPFNGNRTLVLLSDGNRLFVQDAVADLIDSSQGAAR